MALEHLVRTWLCFIDLKTKFALLCISIALPSRSKNSATSEATDTRDSQQGVTVTKLVIFLFLLVFFILFSLVYSGNSSLWSRHCKLLHCLQLSDDF